MTVEEAVSRNLPNECREAEAYGIDLSLLRANLQISPSERLSQLQTMISLHERIQARTVSAALLEARDQREVAEKVALYGAIEPEA